LEILQPVAECVALVLYCSNVQELTLGNHGCYISHRQNDRFIAPFDRHPLEIRQSRLAVIHRSVQLRRFVLQRFGFLKTLMSPVDRLTQSLSLNRLQEIVNGMKLKRSDGVFIECGHKGNQGQPVFSYGLDHAQTIKLRHLEIKKSQVWPPVFDYL